MPAIRTEIIPSGVLVGWPEGTSVGRLQGVD